EMILVAEDLDLARGVMQVDEHAVVAHRADPPGDPRLVVGLGPDRQSGIALVELGGLIAARKADRIGIDPHAAQRLQLVEADPAQRVVVIGAHRPGAPLSTLSFRRKPGPTDPHSERLTSGSRLSPGRQTY